MRYVCKSYTNKEIGETIYVSESTLKGQMESILEKLHVRYKAEVVYDLILKEITSFNFNGHEYLELYPIKNSKFIERKYLYNR